MYDRVIANGLVVTGDGVVAADLAIHGERIAAIGRDLNGETVVDASGCYVIPGGVDPHVHLQMPLAGRVSTDTFRTGTIAAACGGTTAIVDFVEPAPEEPMMEAFRARRAEADGQVAIDYGLHMTIPTWHATHDTGLYQVPEAVAAGCATFKCYQAYPQLALDDVALYRAMLAVADAGGLVVLHSETGPLLEILRVEALAAGHVEPIWHERTRPARLEGSAVHRAIEIAHEAECPLHIFHVGCVDSIAAIVAGRSRGVDVTGETCPQYLVLTEEALTREDGHLFVCAPPLRSPEDQQAVWEALAAGDLDFVSTDHCPWTRAEKEQPDFTQIPGGLPSIEARLPLLYQFGVNEGRFDVPHWVKVCCTRPAQRVGLARKGALLPGYDADVVIFDPHRSKTLSTQALHEAADWTPYEGITVQGWPRTVYLRGKAIVQEEEYVGTPGDGRFVPRHFT